MNISTLIRQELSRRELDARTGDGLDIRLLWEPATDKLVVYVIDSKEHTDFEVPVPPGVSPHEVFMHPYAYASSTQH